MKNTYLTLQDIDSMPASLRRQLKRWLKLHSGKVASFPTRQLSLNFDEAHHKPRIKLSELLDAGLIFPQMPVRVRLIREIANELERTYINGMVVSANGCIVYEGRKYERPSPLAMAVNHGRAINGWEYVEVKNRKGNWVKLEELRKLLDKDFSKVV